MRTRFALFLRPCCCELTDGVLRVVLAELGPPTHRIPSSHSGARYRLSIAPSRTAAVGPAKTTHDDASAQPPAGESETGCADYTFWWVWFMRSYSLCRNANWLERQPNNYRSHRPPLPFPHPILPCSSSCCASPPHTHTEGHRAAEGRWSLSGTGLHTWRGHHNGGILSADVHPSECMFATGGKDCWVRCWSTDKVKSTVSYQGHR